MISATALLSRSESEIPRRRRLVADYRKDDRSRSGKAIRSNEISREIDRTEETRAPIITRQCGDMGYAERDPSRSATQYTMPQRSIAGTRSFLARRIPTRAVIRDRARTIEKRQRPPAASRLHRKCVEMAPTDLRVIACGREGASKTQKRTRNVDAHTYTGTEREREREGCGGEREMCDVEPKCSHLPTVYYSPLYNK